MQLFCQIVIKMVSLMDFYFIDPEKPSSSRIPLSACGASVLQKKLKETKGVLLSYSITQHDEESAFQEHRG